MDRIFIVYITAAHLTDATTISDHIVAEKLVACTNIIDNMKSCYFWEGKKEGSSEVVLICKTVENKLPELEKCIKRLHAYDCPCFVAWPVEYVSEDYAQWVRESVS